MKKICILIMAGSLIIFFFNSIYSRDLTPPQKTPDLLNQGKRLYETNCSPCHGLKGDGKGPAGLALKPPPRTFNLPFSQWTYSKGDLKKIFEVITKGIPNTAMVKWDHLSEQERWELVYFVAGFATSEKPPKKR